MNEINVDQITIMNDASGLIDKFLQGFHSGDMETTKSLLLLLDGENPDIENSFCSIILQIDSMVEKAENTEKHDELSRAEIVLHNLFINKISSNSKIRYNVMAGHLNHRARMKAVMAIIEQGEKNKATAAIKCLYGKNIIYNTLMLPYIDELDFLSKIGEFAAPAVPAIIATMERCNRRFPDSNYHATLFASMSALKAIGTHAEPAIPLLQKIIQFGEKRYEYDCGLPNLAIETLRSIGIKSLPSLNRLRRLVENRGKNRHFDGMRQDIVDAIFHLIEELENTAIITQWDLEASSYTKQLKVFYLTGLAYKHGAKSFREASKILSQSYESDIFKSDLPISNVSLKNNIEKLLPLFCKIQDRKTFSLFLEVSGMADQFSEDAWIAWRWTEGYLGRVLTPDWFGFRAFLH